VWAYWQEINISSKPGIVYTEFMHIKLLYDWFSYLFVLQWMQLEDGDIICFQKAPAIDNEEHIRYPDVPSYLEYVHNRQVFSLRFN
jgi:hypothetical protein